MGDTVFCVLSIECKVRSIEFLAYCYKKWNSFRNEFGWKSIDNSVKAFKEELGSLENFTTKRFY